MPFLLLALLGCAPDVEPLAAADVTFDDADAGLEASTVQLAIEAEVAARTALAARVGTAETDVVTLVSADEAFSLRFSELEGTVASLTQTTAELGGSLTSLWASLEELSGTVSELVDIASALDGRLLATEVAVSALEGAASTLDAGLSSANDAITALDVRVGSVDSSVAGLTTRLSSAESDLTALDTRVEALEDGQVTSIDGLSGGTVQGDVSVSDGGRLILDAMDTVSEGGELYFVGSRSYPDAYILDQNEDNFRLLYSNGSYAREVFVYNADEDAFYMNADLIVSGDIR